MRKILLALLSVTILGCQNNKKEEVNPHELDKYIYLDDMNILHCDENCYRLRHGKDENGHQIYAKVPIDTTGLVLGDGQRFCSNCVDQECYEHLKAISNRNMWEHTDSLVW